MFALNVEPSVHYAILIVNQMVIQFGFVMIAKKNTNLSVVFVEEKKLVLEPLVRQEEEEYAIIAIRMVLASFVEFEFKEFNSINKYFIIS